MYPHEFAKALVQLSWIGLTQLRCIFTAEGAESAEFSG